MYNDITQESIDFHEQTFVKINLYNASFGKNLSERLAILKTIIGKIHGILR